jgi:hypothetical protein
MLTAGGDPTCAGCDVASKTKFLAMALQSWLHAALLELFPTDAWVVDGVAAALLACDTEDEACATVTNFLGESDRTSDVVADLFARKQREKSGGALSAPPDVIVGADGRQARAYHKAPVVADSTPRKQAAATVPTPRASSSSAAVAQSTATSGPLWLCRVVNCLRCGKVHDCRGDEASLPASLIQFLATNVCTFCGAPVRDGDQAETSGHETDSAAEAAAAAAASAAHERLVAFDREGVGRSRLIDDQSDYVTAEEANPWLSPEERAALKAAAAKAAAAEEEDARRRRTTVTIDLIGRRVVSAAEKDEADVAAREQSLSRRAEMAQAADAAAAATAAEGEFGGGRSAQLATDAAQRLREGDEGQQLRMMANPGAPRTPVFVRQIGIAGGAKAQGRGETGKDASH